MSDALKAQAGDDETSSRMLASSIEIPLGVERELPDFSGELAQLEPRNFASLLHRASEAVTALADRLNAVVMRAALLNAVRKERNGAAMLESYLTRLDSLIESTAQHMRLIQKLLAIIEASTLQTVHADHPGGGERKD